MDPSGCSHSLAVCSCWGATIRSLRWSSGNSVAEIDEVLVLIREFCQRNRAELQQIPADPRARFCDEHGYLYP